MDETKFVRGLISTKYELGEKFWIMRNNELLCINIVQIKLDITFDNIKPLYIAGGQWHRESELDSYARTKKELMLSIFGVDDEERND